MNPRIEEKPEYSFYCPFSSDFEEQRFDGKEEEGEPEPEGEAQAEVPEGADPPQGTGASTLHSSLAHT